MKVLHLISNSFFIRAEYTAKSEVDGGGTLWIFVIFHELQSQLSRERKEIKIRTFFRWNRLAIRNRIDLVRIFKDPFRITIRKLPPEKEDIIYKVRLNRRSLVKSRYKRKIPKTSGC
jgi:hypothetical protein